MAITREKKVEILTKLKEALGQAKTVVFVNFHGLPVTGATQLRDNLRQDGVGYMVAKKTLIRKAFESQSTEGDMPTLDGEIALAYGLPAQAGEDPLLPAKGVYDFHKKNVDVVKIVGGVYEGKFLDARSMIEIATIPSKEVLYAQFVNVINSPIQGFVMALDQIAKARS
jgi:large subunit ribosomal protein L10